MSNIIQFPNIAQRERELLDKERKLAMEKFKLAVDVQRAHSLVYAEKRNRMKSILLHILFFIIGFISCATLVI